MTGNSELRAPTRAGTGGRLHRRPLLPLSASFWSRQRSFCWLPIVVVAAYASIVGPLHAQEGDARPPSDRCEHPLPQGGQKPGGGAGSLPDTQTNGHGGADLSRKLGDCGGVLNAPSVGDGGMVTPAPETGRERVIRPGMLPPGTNSGNGG